MSRSPVASIALVGDYRAEVTAHQAIPVALRRVSEEQAVPLQFDWISTSDLGANGARSLEPYHGVWCVPAGPYADTRAALSAIRWARESGTPFLGTCAGFQHALLEYAHHVLHMTSLAHAELDPHAQEFLIAPLSCALVEKSGGVRFKPGSRLARAYGRLDAVEGYHCSFGLAPGRETIFKVGGLEVTARDAAGEARAVELSGHPFFVATLFQPERAALQGETPPIVRAFVEAIESNLKARIMAPPRPGPSCPGP